MENAQGGLDTALSEENIAEVIAGWTGIPLTKINETESDRLLNLEDTLHKRVIGQTMLSIQLVKLLEELVLVLKIQNVQSVVLFS